MAAAGAAAGARSPRLRGGPGVQPPALPEEQSVPQTGRLQRAGGDTGRGRRCFCGGRGWRVAPCPALCLPARKALGLGPAQAARAPARRGAARRGPGREEQDGAAMATARQGHWAGSTPAPGCSLGTSSVLRLHSQVPAPGVLGLLRSSPPAGRAASRAGASVIPAPTSSTLGARGWGWPGHGHCSPQHGWQCDLAVAALAWLLPAILLLGKGTCHGPLHLPWGALAPTGQPCCEEGTGTARDGLAAAGTLCRQSLAPREGGDSLWADGSATLSASRRPCTALGTAVPHALPQPCPQRSRTAGTGTRAHLSEGAALEVAAAEHARHDATAVLPRHCQGTARCPVAITDVFGTSCTTACRSASSLPAQTVPSPLVTAACPKPR